MIFYYQPFNAEIKKRSIHCFGDIIRCCARMVTGAFIDDGFLIDYLTPEEYFYFIGKMYGLKKEEVDERLIPFERFMSGEVIGHKKLIRNYSAGNKQKIGIISAMLHYPQLLILDEPFNFLDPSSQSIIKHLLKKYNEEHQATVIISSHNLNHTVDVCPRIAFDRASLFGESLYGRPA